jgi:glyoxylate reductase
MKPNVFVPQPIPKVALEMLEEYAEVEVWPYDDRAISVAELAAGCGRSDYLFGYPHSMPITESMIAANPNLLGIATGSYPLEPSTMRKDLSGVAAAEAAGVPFLINDPSARRGGRGNAIGGATSNLMVALLLNCAYRTAEADRYCRRLGYFQEMTMDLMGVGTYGKTVSLIGLGGIARGAIPALRGLGLEILYTKRNRLDGAEEEALGVTWVENRDELISRGDFVSLLANWEEANLKMFGAREFALMKPTAYFINVSRGRLVDEEAMIAALDDGTIAGAGLDVFWDEPPNVFQPYTPKGLRRANTVLTPHNGGATWDARGRGAANQAQLIIDDIKRRQAEEAVPA